MIQKLVLLMLCFLAIISQAEANEVKQDLEYGELDVFIFEGGSPKIGVKLKIDGREFTTDSSGGVYLKMPQKQYKLEIDGDKRPFNVAKNQGTRILINVTEEKMAIDISEPEFEDDRLASSEAGNSNESGSKNSSGEIVGRVVSAEGAQPIANAKVYISSSKLSTPTNENGEFSLKSQSGKHTLSVIHSDFSAFILENVEVTEKTPTKISANLVPLAKINFQDIVVTAPQLAGSLAALIQERKQSANVTDILASEQISKSGDGDAGAALRRVTGLTLMDGKYIYVRGLGERYSASLLNSSVLPSPHPARRVVPLDLFPSSILEGVTIQKTYTPDMPAEFGGGVVLLKTKSIPEKNFFSLGLSTSYVDGVTASSGDTYRGGKKDWTGYDDGTRALPSLVKSLAGDRKISEQAPGNEDGFSGEQITAMGQSFNQYYDRSSKKIPLGSGINLSFGGKQKIANMTAGGSLSLIYGRDYSESERYRQKYNVVSAQTSELAKDTESISRGTRSEVKLGTMAVVGAKNNFGSELRNTFLIVRKTEDLTQLDDQTSPNNANIHYLKTTLSWQERQLFINQIAFDQTFKSLNNLSLALRHTYAQAKLYAPDRRQYQYNQDPTEAILNATPTRLFSDLIDDSYDTALDLKLPLKFSDDYKIALLAGVQTNNRKRESEVRRFNYGDAVRAEDQTLPVEQVLTQEKIGNGLYNLQETTIATDNYKANQAIDAFYGAFDLEMWQWLRLYAGVRYEESKQEVETFALYDPEAEPLVADLKTLTTLPVFSLTFTLKKDMQLRLSKSKTISRPDFKELSPAQYYDDENNMTIQGNQNLKSTSIQNYDIRWETYFKDNQNLSLGLFYKEFRNPIELEIIPAAVDDLYSYSNAKSAYVQGVELDGRVNLDKAAKYYLASNLTYIMSEVDLSSENSIQTSKKRALQGQSAYVQNYTLGYDDSADKISYSMLYNLFGSRIREVGTHGAPDVTEKPFGQIDLVAMKTFKTGIKTSLKLKNLFPKDSVFEQGAGNLSQRRKTYRSASLDLSYSF